MWPLIVLGGAAWYLSQPRRNPQLAFDFDAPMQGRDAGIELAKELVAEAKDKYVNGRITAIGKFPSTAQVREVIELQGYPYRDEYKVITEQKVSGLLRGYMEPLETLAAGEPFEKFWPSWYEAYLDTLAIRRRERPDLYKAPSPIGVEGKRSSDQKENYRKRFVVYIDPKMFKVGLANAKRFGGTYDSDEQSWEIPGTDQAIAFMLQGNSGWLDTKPIKRDLNFFYIPSRSRK